MKECDTLGVTAYSDPSYIFPGGQDPQAPMIYAPVYTAAVPDHFHRDANTLFIQSSDGTITITALQLWSRQYYYSSG